jgi:DNA polymerase-3 subunit epsilon
MISFFHKSESPLIQNYLAATKSRRPWKTPLMENRFVVIDTETSGFDVGTDRILSIAIFEIINGQIDMTLCRKWIVFQPESALTAATAIHGILPSETREGMDEKKVLEELIPLLTGAVVVGHHIRFDAAMINEAMVRHFKANFSNRIVDTAIMAMRELAAFHQTGYENQRPPSLNEVCSQLNMPIVARHTAEGDAYLAAQIFLFLCGRIRRRLHRRPVHRRPPKLRDLSANRFRE